MKKKIIYQFLTVLLLLPVLIIFFYSCNHVSDSLAPYVGSPDISKIEIQSGTFTPKVNWVGGYVTVFGVNRDTVAALDSSLVWLIYIPNDGIHYPVKYGDLPAGAQDITAQYGGKFDTLSEDKHYTFWVMKQDAWTKLSSEKNKYLTVDSVNQNSEYTMNGDTIKINPLNYYQLITTVDVFINIDDINTYGRLALLNVVPTNKDNSPIFSWQIVQPGLPDTMISAMGICQGQEYSIRHTIWEIYSTQDSAGKTIYGKNDFITPPVKAGQNFSGTRIFTQYPPEGLLRGEYYYIWIADKTWDQTNRIRSTKGYAFMTFRTY